MNCYFVFGPESSGNRLMARILIAAGCEGDPDEFQREFHDLLLSGKENIVLHRSFPYGAKGAGRHFPDIPQLVAQAKEYGYTPTAVVMMRDILCATRSAAKSHTHGDEDEAVQNYLQAITTIFSGIKETELDYCPINYESLVKNKQVLINWLLPALGFSSFSPLDEEINDANDKWYDRAKLVLR